MIQPNQCSPDHITKNSDLVSVLMPLYDCAETMEASIASVLAQTHHNWELILIDDASPDVDTLRLARKLAATDPRIKILSMAENGGAAAARNLGLEASQGRFIAFLDADDLWLADKLNLQLAFMKQHGAAISFTGYTRISHPQGQLIKRIPALPRVDYAQLLKYNPMGCLTVMYDTEACGKVAMPNLRRQHDYALWLQLVRINGAALGLNKDLGLYRVRAGSLSADKKAAVQDMWQVLRYHEKLPFWRAVWAFGQYAAHSLRYRVREQPDPQGPVLLPSQES